MQSEFIRDAACSHALDNFVLLGAMQTEFGAIFSA